MSSRGFTLIELIIAIFILSIGIVGIFGAYSAMIVAVSDTSERATATYLAQDGIEIVKNIRNINWANISKNPTGGFTWVDGLTGCASGCEADYTAGVSSQMTTWGLSSDGTPGNYLYVDKDTGFYDYLATTGSKTQFKRKITITCFSSADSQSVDPNGCSSADPEMKVSVTAYWDKKASLVSSGGLAGDNTGSGHITIEDRLYNWK